ncbi:putative hydrolase or acyltransferase of alpha/beta superfamily [Nostoc sp. PCC 7524]|uniref:alpha/beta fold hydrolase n=1 Tax=Nostoc sp. (strain ATCC 29411 / PCC 7524) TaxID=28072 RepID=UPI00029F4304|nr:alpha/beta hydrolase [Nostoc sp. PCC 7524]AFY50590.1 putative hydrolase or acyltransferase of alpha/beta superfamily [Nostoc sp. PCC 7524]
MDTLLRNARRKLSQGLLFWREAGEGIPIVFLHGNWHDSGQWVAVMESLYPNFHCFAPDLLGFGESDHPNIHYSIDVQVECMAEFLQALKLEKVNLVGHSLGGWIAASYALKYGQQVDKLVLVAPEGVKISGQEAYWQKMQQLLKRSPLFFKIMRSLRFLTKIFRLDEKIEQDWQLRQMVLQYPTACQLLFQRQQPELEAELLQSRLSDLAIPVLIVQGGKDAPDTLARSQAYSKLIEQVELKIIAHAGNDLPTSCVGVMAGDIRDFILGNK